MTWSKKPKDTSEQTITSLPVFLKNCEYAHLVQDTTLLMDEEEIRNTIMNKSIFEMALDGSHCLTSRKSSYGWTISMNQQLVTKGKGPVPAAADLASPFRAEAYG